VTVDRTLPFTTITKIGLELQPLLSQAAFRETRLNNFLPLLMLIMFESRFEIDAIPESKSFF